MAHTITGISIGTRTIGIAVISNGTLVDWQVKSFKGTMNQQKLHMISGAILKLIHRYDCTEAVFKLPNKAQSYISITMLKKHLMKALTRHNISLHFYYLCDIKSKIHPQICNKHQLTTWAVTHYTELRFIYLKQQRLRNPYYMKIFEAVIVLHIHIHGT